VTGTSPTARAGYGRRGLADRELDGGPESEVALVGVAGAEATELILHAGGGEIADCGMVGAASISARACMASRRAAAPICAHPVSRVCALLGGVAVGQRQR
jgi:hypothetical protein